MTSAGVMRIAIGFYILLFFFPTSFWSSNRYVLYGIQQFRVSFDFTLELHHGRVV